MHDVVFVFFFLSQSEKKAKKKPKKKTRLESAPACHKTSNKQYMELAFPIPHPP